jgi:integrase
VPSESNNTTSFLFCRDGVYYFRHRVPVALRAHFNVDEIRKSLLTRDPDEARRLAQAEAERLEAQFDQLRAAQRAAAGTKPSPFADEARITAGPFGELFERWNARASRPRTTVYDFAKAARRFAALHPDVRISEVRPAHVEAFRDALVAEQLSAGTVRKQVGALAAMLQGAVEEGVLITNPARGVVPRAPRERPERVDFDGDELAAIFGSPIYARGERPTAGAGDAAFWLPLLALYTGARQGEIGSMRVEDVREAGGVIFLDVLTEHIRSDAALRRPVPVHPDLLKLGFLQFAEMQRRAGEELLFHELRADNKGKITGNWSKWFARYLRQTVGICDSRKTFDSFRHTFLTMCRDAGIDPALVDALTGRRTRRGAKQRDVTLAKLAEAISTLRFRLPARHEQSD